MLRTRAWRGCAATTTASCASATPAEVGRDRARRLASRRAVDAGNLDEYLALVLGAELLGRRLALVEALRPYLGKAYEAVAPGASRDDAT